MLQIYRLLSLKLQWLRLHRLRRRPPVRWLQPPLRRLCQFHSLSLRLVQLCRRIFTPQACLLRPCSRPEWHLRRSLLPYQQWPFQVNVSPDLLKLSVGELSASLSVQAPSMGPYVGSSSNLPPVPQWLATTPGFQPHSASFPPGQTQQFIIHLQLATGIAAAAHWSINIVPLRNHKLCSQRTAQM